MTQRFRHAYALLTYCNRDGSEREVVWNSRDGDVPRTIASSITGIELVHKPELNKFAPDHLPKVGDRVLVDLTEQRARVLAERLVDRMWNHVRAVGPIPSGREILQREFRDSAEAIDSISRDMLQHRVADLVEVTSGFLEQLDQRRRAAPVDSFGKPVDVDHDVNVENGRDHFTSMRSPDGRFELENSVFELEPHFYDRVGDEISRDQWKVLRADARYVELGRDLAGRYTVLTRWNGIWGKQRPRLIFQTELIGDSDVREVIDAHPDEATARRRHHEILDVVRAANDEAEQLIAELLKAAPVKLEPITCACGRLLWDDERAMRSGDYVICVYCGQIYEVTPDGRTAAITLEQVSEPWRDSVAGVQQSVRRDGPAVLEQEARRRRATGGNGPS